MPWHVLVVPANGDIGVWLWGVEWDSGKLYDSLGLKAHTEWGIAGDTMGIVFCADRD